MFFWLHELCVVVYEITNMLSFFPFWHSNVIENSMTKLTSMHLGWKQEDTVQKANQKIDLMVLSCYCQQQHVVKKRCGFSEE